MPITITNYSRNQGCSQICAISKAYVLSPYYLSHARRACYLPRTRKHYSPHHGEHTFPINPQYMSNYDIPITPHLAQINPRVWC